MLNNSSSASFLQNFDHAEEQQFSRLWTESTKKLIFDQYKNQPPLTSRPKKRDILFGPFTDRNSVDATAQKRLFSSEVIRNPDFSQGKPQKLKISTNLT